MATINQPRNIAITLIAAIVIGGGVFGTLWWRQHIPLPAARFVEPVVVLGERPQFHLELEASRGNVTSLEVRLVQGEIDAVAFSEDYSTDRSPSRSVDVHFELRPLGLKEGEAMLVVRTTDDFVRPRETSASALETPVSIDLTPPPLAVRSATRYLSPGGAGISVLYAIDAEQLGVMVGDRWFKAYPSGTDGLYMALFALDVGHDPAIIPTAVALDAAGNRALRELPVVIQDEPVALGSVPLSTDWLRRKLPPLLPARTDFSDEALPEAFREVSIGLRAEAATERDRLAGLSGDRRLWSDRFQQIKNAQVMSRFGVRRTYVLDGDVLDEKVHQGYDLASVAMAEIPAANSGIVVHAGPLTIYGNSVIIDHGQGLLTLYGHCSSLDVAVGDTVRKGQTIARTGATGLAGGDHLHFEVIVGGVPVSPLQWLDGAWIESHIEQPLAEGGISGS
jgi:murein DD-endopeptidase MepM/ murein hydrolase activator NlpD